MSANKFRGTGVALVTPFTSNKEIDFPALEKLINHVIAGGVNYLVALGTTGETPTLSLAEKKTILQFVLDTNQGRVPVVCGIGGNNTAEVIENLHDFSLEGVDAILSVAPYYNKPSQAGVIAHFAEVSKHSPKPIILYNVPGRTGSNMTSATSLHLARTFENIIAIKEASGNMAQCMELVAGKPEGFSVLSGDDDLVVAQVAIGFDGVISVAANCFTHDFCSMVQDALANRYKEARQKHYRLLEGIGLLFAEGNPAGVKCVLAEMGICENQFRLPVVPVSEGTHAKIKRYLAGLQ